jgi:hypothetical protein
VRQRLLALAIGTGAALRSLLWITGPRLQRLLRDAPAPAPAGAPRPPELATRASQLALRVLARLPFLPWRNTCLYRSVAECLALRDCGICCHLELGVSRDAVSGESIVAHAWVERADRPRPDHPLVPLRPGS